MTYFVLVTGINQENLAQRRLQEKGFEVYYPLGRKVVRHARREETRIFPVFSRYIFVKSTHEWGGMREADGVIDILTNNFTPLEVDSEIIEDIKYREKHGQFDIIPPKRNRPKWVKPGVSKAFDLLQSLLNPETPLSV